MEVRIFFYIFVVLMGYDLTLADMTKMIFLPDAEEQPPPSCPPNEMFRNCLGNCSNCEERGFCSYTTCSQSGCDCWPRFFRLTPGGPCEPVGKCPKKECPENEVFRECGPLCERCGLFGCRLIQCNHQCYCKEGYKRDFFGDCVPEDECPQRHHCSKGEEAADSGPVDEFCLEDPLHPRTTEIQNVRKCYCQEGYKRNALGHCIEERLCAYVSCIGNEVYMNCVPACNTTCRNYGDPDCKEDGQCYPGCFCPPGYVMNDYHVCIPVENCATENDRLPFFDTHEERKSETSSQTTAAAESQTAIPPEEKTESNSQTQAEAQSEGQSETQTGSPSETQVESQSETQETEQSEYQTEDEPNSQGEQETQAEKPPEIQDADEPAEAAVGESQLQEDTQTDSETAEESQSEPVSDEADTEAYSQSESNSESKTASENEGDGSIAKEETEEEAPVDEGNEKQPDAAEEPATDEVDEPETTTTTKRPKQSRRRSNSGSRSYKTSKGRKQFHEENNE
ncbi:paternally-expressed gene 3 protein-like [Uloborus diversus]|uniref:paternally-expressed gene 3 protein-like n=1 Tax=Uloborus diversus TaxID=327109 RepID=UPI00240A1832|nr:paternally-expressed gene 3 protein-like [Uloborus diversus]